MNKKKISAILLSISVLITMVIGTSIAATAATSTKGPKTQRYTITTKLSKSKKIEVEKDYNIEGDGVVLKTKNPTSRQKFDFIPTKDGYYLIRSVYSKLYLTNVGECKVQQQKLYTDEVKRQQWKVKKLKNGYVEIISVQNLKWGHLDVEGESSKSGTSIGVWESTGNSNQKWKLTKVK